MEFGVYIHWPFCQAKCPYCDFNSHVWKSVDQIRWRDAFIRSIETAAARQPGRVVNSVFFGGGTPSLMPVGTVDAVLSALRSGFSFANDIEVTLEANPTSSERSRFAGYRDAGVNRVSLGVQALDDQDLHHLGRLHTVQEALAAVEMARDLFDRVSFDLIYARQHQTEDMWRSELSRALSFEPDHLSLYQLTVEDGTRFGDLYKRGRLRGLPSPDLGADLYDATQELCEEAGLPAYETSNHARSGAASRHNMIYWQAGDYLGIGPGAHGRVPGDRGRHATEDLSSPATWLDAVERTGSGLKLEKRLTAQDQVDEYLMMGLRIEQGVSLGRIEGMGGAFDQSAMAELISSGHLIQQGDRLQVTRSGRPLLNAILRQLL